MLLRKRKRLEENDKKSGKSRRVWKSLWGSYAAGTGTFLMCGHHFVQHEEDVGAHLPSLLHSGFPQKVRVNVKNVFLLCKGLKSPALKGLSELSYDWKCLFSPVGQSFGENMTFVSFHSGHVAIFEITDSVQSRIFLYFCLCVTSISSQLFSSSIIWLYWL